MTPDAENGGLPAGEAEAWADVLAGWGDEARHHAYLARFHDLGDLAIAGRRYRDELAARPGDPTALRWRDEVLRRAAAAGIASLPRTTPARRETRWVKPLAIAAGIALTGWLLVFGSRIVGALSGGAP